MIKERHRLEWSEMTFFVLIHCDFLEVQMKSSKVQGIAKAIR